MVRLKKKFSVYVRKRLLLMKENSPIRQTSCGDYRKCRGSCTRDTQERKAEPKELGRKTSYEIQDDCHTCRKGRIQAE